MKRHHAIIFDLFSTLALWRKDRMPLFEWRGRTSHSTLGALRETVETCVAHASFATFVDALEAANETLAARRAAEQREFPSRVRFELALYNAGYPKTDDTSAVAEELSLRHMALLAAAVDIPATHTETLATLAQHYPLALLSNFDHGDTARAILERDGAAAYFDAIVISDEHGWRKPHRKIFDDTLAQLGVAANAALYVGDSVGDDIVGAAGAGLAVAWVNAAGNTLPDNAPRPDYTITAVPELVGLLD